MTPGTGNITVNGRALDEFFGRVTGRMIVRQPLETTDMLGRFDFTVHVDRRWHHRPGRRHPSRHHPRADPVR